MPGTLPISVVRARRPPGASWAWRSRIEQVGAFKIRGDQALDRRPRRWTILRVVRVHAGAPELMPCLTFHGCTSSPLLSTTVESDMVEHGCPSCEVLAVGHGRRVHVVHDAPCFGQITLVRWLKRIWRCREPICPTTTFSEAHDLAPAARGAHHPGGGVGD